MPGEVIVFDMDGVLVDVTFSYRETIRQTVKHFTGAEISNERIQQLKNAGGWTNDWAVAHRLIQDLGFDVRYEDVVVRFQQLFLGSGDGPGLIRQERWIAEPGLLERLSRRAALAVFTGRPREEAWLTLNRFAKEIAFHPVIGAEDVARGKPEPDGLILIARQTGAARMWYVGDTVDDARSAQAAGVPFLGVAAPGMPRRQELVERFTSLGAKAVIEDINQLEGVLPDA